MNSKELYEQIKALWEEFEENHEKFAEKVTKQQVVGQESLSVK